MTERRAEEAIVLAGGLGTRLRSVVSDVPKPLAPVAGRPFLAWVLDRLADAGLRRTILATGYLADRLEATIGSEWRGMSIAYSVEEAPLGTGGAFRRALRQLQGERVHLLNGDTYLEYSPQALEATMERAGAKLGVALAAVPDTGRYGVVQVSDGRVVAFAEKGAQGPGWINAGCYCVTAEALRQLPEREAFSLEREWLPGLAAEGAIAAFDRTAGFIDIGVPEDFRRAQLLFQPG